MDFTKLVRFDGDDSAGDPPADDAAPEGGDDKAQIESFEKFLESQPDDVKKLYEDHTHGLKSALQKEREANQAAEPKLKALAKLEEEREKAKIEGMTPEEKALAELAAERTKREEAEQKQRELHDRLRQTTKERRFDEAMIDLDLWFVDEAAQNDAYKMLDEEKFDDDYSTMEDAIKKLAKSRSYLFKVPKKEDSEDTKTKGDKGKGKTDTEKKEREAKLKKKYRIA